MAGENTKARNHAYGYDQYWGGGHRSWHGSQLDAFDAEGDLAELVARLKEYDGLRLGLEREGGDVSTLERLNRCLAAPLGLGGRGNAQEARLTDRAGLNQALHRLHWDLKLEARFNSNRMPVYYLCRGKSDYWSEYSLIVEDYYLSPGYPLLDERFVKLMQGGHDNSFLRISHLRQGMKRMLEDGPPGQDRGLGLDEKLHAVGRHVLQAAWHQDQQLGLLTARHFELPRFWQAVELLYLCLGGELCELRGAMDQVMLDFFSQVYPQPTLREFLERLPGLDGKRLNELPKAALAQYRRLGQAFSAFICTDISWQGMAAGRRATPLWKLIYANLGRLDRMAGQARTSAACREASLNLEAEAGRVIAALMEALA